MNNTLEQWLRDNKTLSSLTTEELINLYDSTDITSAVFTVVEAEVIRRLTSK